MLLDDGFQEIGHLPDLRRIFPVIAIEEEAKDQLVALECEQGRQRGQLLRRNPLMDRRCGRHPQLALTSG